MEQNKKPSGNPFATQHRRSTSSGAARPENAIDILARELGGLPAKPGGPASATSSRQQNYSPLSSSVAASGQLPILPNSRPVSVDSAIGRSIMQPAMPTEGADNRTAQRIESSRTAGTVSDAATSRNAYGQGYSPMKASRAASGQVPAGMADRQSHFGQGGGPPAFESRNSTQGISLLDHMPALSLQSTSSVNTPRVQELVEVDGTPPHVVDTWFAEADSDHNGYIADKEAVAFFKRTGLPGAALSMIWNRVKAVSVSGQAGLNRMQFSVALRLVALAQSGQPLTDDLTRDAVNPHRWLSTGRAPLPPPKLGPVPRLSAELERSPISSHHVRAKPQGNVIDLADLRGQSGQDAFANLAAQRRAINPPAQPLEQEREPTGESPSAHRAAGRMNEAPICFEARLPPLHPKKCSRLSMLTAGHGSLFAGPSNTGGLLQWARPEGNMRRPTLDARSLQDDTAASEQSNAGLNEDPDVAPSLEALLPDSKQVSCVHMDEVNNVLWVGHADGKVSAYALGPVSGSPIINRRIHHWQAHKLGRVTAICSTAWGEVWTGSSRGTIRVWRTEMAGTGNSIVTIARELRRQGGFRASSNGICFLVVPPCGQVVWSGSAKSLLIWDAFTGSYLGSVQRGDSDLDRESSRKYLEHTHSEREERFIPRLQIDNRRGLELDENGKVVVKAFTSRRSEIIAEQEAWAIQTDKKTSEWVENVGVLGGRAIDNAGKAAGKAGKFIGRMGGKLVRNITKGDSTSSEVKALREGQTYSASRSRLSLEQGPEAAASGLDQGEDSAPDIEIIEKGGKDGQLKALVADSGNCVWAAWQNGRMERYAFNGRLLTKKDLQVGICSLAVVGPRLWVGLVDGRIRVLADKNTTKEWRAHEAGILQLTMTGSRVYSLAADGSVRGWCSTVPSEYDQVARQAQDNAAPSLIEQERLEVLCLTWNVNEQKPDGGRSAFFGRVTRLASSDTVKLVVVGLQEIEMGGGSVAMAAAKDALHKKAQEKGNTNGQWWASQLQVSLGGPSMWRQFGLRQLSGMLVLLFARTDLEGKIGEVSTSSVACGVLGVGGNKGAVAVSFTLCRRRIACVCSHFAAHQSAVEARYHNYLTITKNLTFSKLPWFDLQAYPDEDDHIQKQAHRLQDTVSDSASDNESPSESAEPDMIQGQGMRAAEMLVWVGDFNYRINCTYEEAKECIRRNRLENLLEKDQLRAEIRSGRVFQHLREGTIRFPPTYKFNKHDPDPFGYDTSEKRRVPAWTDRIFFRGSFRRDVPDDDMGGASLIDGFEPEEQPRVGKVEAITVEAVEYSAGMDITDSDHKPVWARLAVTLPVTLQDKKRRKCSHLLKDCFLHSVPEPPRVSVTQSSITLHPIEERAGVLEVNNCGSSAVVVRVVPLVESWQRPPTDAPREIPDWLDIFPVCARIPPQASLRINVSLSLAEASWARKDKKALLRLRVDHDFAAGGERPEGGNIRDKYFTVHCTTQSRV